MSYKREKSMSAKLGVSSIFMLILVATLAACGGGGGGTDGASGGSAGSAGGAGAGSGGNATTTGTTSGTDTLPSTDSSLTGKESPPPGIESQSAPPPVAAAPPPGTVEFWASFPDLWEFRSNTDSPVGISNDGMWWVEQKYPGRAMVVYGGRDGGTALRLHTEPGDNYVSGSGENERNDVALQYMDGWQGQEQWWAHSIMFPDDFATPPSWIPESRAVVFDFHDTRNQGGQANFHVFVESGGRLTFRGHGGPSVDTDDAGDQYSYGAEIGQLQKNVWYDFVYHVKWSAYGDGYIQAWVNGVLKLEHYGPTLYEGYGVYLKLANYHTPIGQPSSVIHDRVVRGTSWQAVSMTQLEGVWW
jgi:Polysaccharide lyase